MKPKEKSEELGKNEKKWGAPLMKAGWSLIPDIIIQKQAALGLEPIDFSIVMILCTFWWERDRPARPGKRRIATALGVDPRTIQRRIQKLERLGLVERRERKNRDGDNDPNEYLLTGLVTKATPFALEKLALKEQHAKEEEQRAKRGRARIRIVGKDGK